MVHIETGILITNQGVLEINGEIDDNKGVIKPLESRKYVNPNDAMTLLSMTSSTQILPNNCKFITTPMNSSYTTMVIEEPPRIRTIKIKASVLAREIDMLNKTGKMKEFKIDEFLKKNEKNYQGDIYYELSLSFPYVIFLITLGRYGIKYAKSCARVFFRTAPIKSLDDKLIISPTTNFDGNDLCSPSEAHPSMKYAAESVVRGFWNALFTEHGSGYYFNYLQRDINVSSWLMWQVLTKKDPNFIFSEDWAYAESSISGHLRDMVQRSGNIRDFIDIFTKSHRLTEDLDKISIYSEWVFKYGDRQILLSQGDEVNYDDKTYFIEHFGRDRYNSNMYVYLDPYDENDSKLEFKLDAKIQDTLLKNFTSRDILEIEHEGVKIKVGDVVSFKYQGNNKNGLVKKIRKNRFGLWEVKLSGSFFTLLTDELLETYKVKFDYSSNIKKNFGIEIVKTGLRRPLAKIFVVGELLEILDHSDNDMTFSFKSTNSKEADFTATSSSVILHNYDEFSKDLEKHELIEHKGLLFINHPNVLRDGYEYFTREGEILIKKNVRCESYYHYDPKCINQMLDLILTKDGINIPSTEKDIKLAIGDPICMFKDIGDITLGRIFGIIKNTANMGIDVEIIKTDNTTITVPYVKILTNRHYASRSFANGMVERKTIVKLYGQHNGIRANSKIISKFAKIPSFSKNSVNSIVGFILDFERPMAVCSNGMTLYCDGLTDLFEVIPQDDRRYNLKKFELNHRLSNYTPLPGDMCQYTSTDSLVINDISSRGVNCSLTSAPEVQYSIYKKEVKPIGLLFPRFENEEFIPATQEQVNEEEEEGYVTEDEDNTTKGEF